MAFLSDIHGNLRALEAVLEELDRRGIARVFVCGDLLLGGDAPVEVFKRLRQVNAECTRGLSEAALVSVAEEELHPVGSRQRALADRFLETRRALGELAVRYLSQLPEMLRIPLMDGSEIAMVHGSPADPFAEMTHDMTDDELFDLIDDDPADILVCGASHVPFQRQLEGVCVVNVGSAGQAPEGDVAHFTVISPRLDGTVIEQAWVEYGEPAHPS